MLIFYRFLLDSSLLPFLFRFPWCYCYFCELSQRWVHKYSECMEQSQEAKATANHVKCFRTNNWLVRFTLNWEELMSSRRSMHFNWLTLRQSGQLRLLIGWRVSNACARRIVHSRGGPRRRKVEASGFRKMSGAVESALQSALCSSYHITRVYGHLSKLICRATQSKTLIVARRLKCYTSVADRAWNLPRHTWYSHLYTEIHSFWWDAHPPSDTSQCNVLLTKVTYKSLSTTLECKNGRNLLRCIDECNKRTWNQVNSIRHCGLSPFKVFIVLLKRTCWYALESVQQKWGKVLDL